MKIIPKDRVTSSFNPLHEPIARVTQGEAFWVETEDCYGGRITSELQKRRQVHILHVNCCTGPIFVESAMPGDTLVVEVLDIEVAGQGVMVTMPGMGVLGHLMAEDETKVIPILEGVAHFSDSIKLPVNPMIGVLGVAPAQGDIPCTVPGDHGSNMDVKLIKKGAKVYLPVWVEGAGLSCGDLHACMGDGELSGTGIEIAGRICLKATVRKELALKRPMLETADGIYTIASDPDLNKAIETACHDMVLFLMRKKNLPLTESYRLLGAACDIQICQVVNDSLTVRVHAPKEILKLDME